MRGWLRLSEVVTDAVNTGNPVVALESTLLAHGLPPGRNLDVAARVEETVRSAGAVPATIAVLDGQARVGLSADELRRVCDPAEALIKLSRRDLGAAIGLGRNGATTVAGTAVLARLAGIDVFATGGLGGVHRGASTSWDVSADLDVLANTPILLVCSGVKSALDIGATLEVLETRSVPVITHGADDFPAFYLRSSGFPAPWRTDTPEQVAAVWNAHNETGNDAGMLLANPIPRRYEMDRELHDRLLAEGTAKLTEQGVRGKDVTPVLLDHFHSASGGVSLTANEELVVSNAALAAQCAKALATDGGVRSRR